MIDFSILVKISPPLRYILSARVVMLKLAMGNTRWLQRRNVSARLYIILSPKLFCNCCDLNKDVCGLSYSTRIHIAEV